MKTAGRLRVLLKGTGDLVDCFLERGKGGSKLERGIETLLSERLGTNFEIIVTHEPSTCSEVLARDLQARAWPGSLVPDIVVLSLHSDLFGADGEVSVGEGASFASSIETSLLKAIRSIKEDIESHVIVLSASTIDPGIQVSDYGLMSAEPRPLLAQRLNLVLIRLSFQEGISVVDADRILAEMGAADHVVDFLDYSPEASAAICGELFRVIEDYGFLDERPLVLQKGRAS